MKFLSPLWILLAFNSGTKAFESCQPGWQLWQGSCYYYDLLIGTWDGLQSKCKNFDAIMVAPRSSEEYEFVRGKSFDKWGDSWIWLGCNDKANEGTWECEDQLIGSVPSWQSEMLSKQRSKHRNCAQSSTTRSRWVDEECDWLQHAVCVQRESSQPTATTRPSQPAATTRPPPNLSCVDPLVQPPCRTRMTQPRSFCFVTDTDGQLFNFRFLEHIIREFVTKNAPGCASACIMEPACRSFNIKRNDKGQKLCQLNNASRCDDPEQFQKVDFFCNYAQECINEL